METITVMAVIALVTFLNVCCFIIGAIVGQKVVKGEKIELPKLNPMEIYRDNQEKKEAAKEMDKLETILRNIERYDGTTRGQEDVPMN
jgi:hypothetical protein